MSDEILNVNIYSDITPHRYQQEFHYWANQKVIKFIILILPRQNSKTTTLLAEACNKLLKQRTQACWVAPTESQAVRAFEKLIVMLSPFLKKEGGSKRTHGQFELNLENGNKISFKPSSSDSIRGMSLNLLICDEFQDIAEDDLNSIVLPCCVANGGNLQVYISGTPKGTSNHLYEWSRRESMGYKGYKTIHLQINDELDNYPNPAIDIDFIRGQKQTMPPRLFDSEYRAKFVSGNGFFSNIEELAVIEQISKPIEGISLFAGADIGLVNDKSSITLVNEFGEMVYNVTLNKKPLPEIISTIQEIEQTFKPRFWAIENNNQGLGCIQSLMLDPLSPMFNIESFNTTYKSKGDILNSLESKLAQRKIKLLKRKDVIEELNDFECKPLPNGRLRLSAPHGKHDDIVISTALAFYCQEKHNRKGEYQWAVV